MEIFGVCTVILMLAALYVRGYWKSCPTFTFIQTIQFLEYPIQKWMNVHHPAEAWYLWHDLNQVNILLGLGSAVAASACFPTVSWLFLVQCFVKMMKYNAIDTNQDFLLDWIYWAHKIIDPVVNICVVWYTLRQRRTHESRTQTAPCRSSLSRTNT